MDIDAIKDRPPLQSSLQRHDLLDGSIVGDYDAVGPNTEQGLSFGEVGSSGIEQPDQPPAKEESKKERLKSKFFLFKWGASIKKYFSNKMSYRKMTHLGQDLQMYKYFPYSIEKCLNRENVETILENYCENKYIVTKGENVLEEGEMDGEVNGEKKKKENEDNFEVMDEKTVTLINNCEHAKSIVISFVNEIKKCDLNDRAKRDCIYSQFLPITHPSFTPDGAFIPAREEISETLTQMKEATKSTFVNRMLSLLEIEGQTEDDKREYLDLIRNSAGFVDPELITILRKVMMENTPCLPVFLKKKPKYYLSKEMLSINDEKSKNSKMFRVKNDSLFEIVFYKMVISSLQMEDCENLLGDSQNCKIIGLYARHNYQKMNMSYQDTETTYLKIWRNAIQSDILLKADLERSSRDRKFIRMVNIIRKPILNRLLGRLVYSFFGKGLKQMVVPESFDMTQFEPKKLQFLTSYGVIRSLGYQYDISENDLSLFIPSSDINIQKQKNQLVQKLAQTNVISNIYLILHSSIPTLVQKIQKDLIKKAEKSKKKAAKAAKKNKKSSFLEDSSKDTSDDLYLGSDRRYYLARRKQKIAKGLIISTSILALITVGFGILTFFIPPIGFIGLVFSSVLGLIMLTLTFILFSMGHAQLRTQYILHDGVDGKYTPRQSSIKKKETLTSKAKKFLSNSLGQKKRKNKKKSLKNIFPSSQNGINNISNENINQENIENFNQENMENINQENLQNNTPFSYSIEETENGGFFNPNYDPTPHQQENSLSNEEQNYSNEENYPSNENDILPNQQQDNNLSSEEMENVSAEQMENLSNEQMENLSNEQMENLSNEQMDNLSNEQMENVSTEQMDNLSTDNDHESDHSDENEITHRPFTRYVADGDPDKKLKVASEDLY